MHTITEMTTEEYRKFQSDSDMIRWTNRGLPPAMYYPVFSPIPSKRKGDIWESKYKDACISLNERLDGFHDASLTLEFVKEKNLRGRRIEIKYAAITTPDTNINIEKRGYALELCDRVKMINMSKPLTKAPGGSFQQIHPDQADYGLFTLVFGNGAYHYWVPYQHMSHTMGAKNADAGKIPVCKMHKGAKDEGQINPSKHFHDLYLLDTTIGTPFIGDLSKYDLQKFDQVVY